MYSNVCYDIELQTSSNYAKLQAIISTSLVFTITLVWFLAYYATYQKFTKRKPLTLEEQLIPQLCCSNVANSYNILLLTSTSVIV